MNARLVSLDGHPSIHLSQTVILVGRHEHCDVRIDSSRVSRRHCCLVLEGDHLVVRDLDSTNGTWVNGDRVAVSRMAEGDELAVGRVRYRLEFGPGPGPCPGPEPDRGPTPPPPAGPTGLDQPGDALGTWKLDGPAPPGFPPAGGPGPIRA